MTEDKNSVDNLYGKSWGSLLQKYQLHLESMNRSPRTIPWYLDNLAWFFVYLQEKALLKPICQLGKSEVQAFILKRQNDVRWPKNTHIGEERKGKLSAYSIQGEVRSIKAFWSWLLLEGYIPENPLTHYPLPKVPQPMINVLTPDQIITLFHNIDRLRPEGERLYCFLILLLDTGLRVSEAVNIKLEDIDIPHGYVHVLGKGQKYRAVPLSAITRKTLLKYIENTRPKLISFGSPYLFLSADGEAISINAIQQSLRRLGHRSGLGGIRCSPHVFRHTFATQSIGYGANTFVLKDIMGHSSLQTTLKYTHLQPHDLRNEHAKFSPVKNLKMKTTRR